MYDKILVPLDGSHRAERILAYVEELARNLGSSLIFLRVVEHDLSVVSDQVTTPEYFVETLERGVKNARDYMAVLQGEYRDRGVRVKTIIEQGPVVETIIKVAESENVDLVAMASHGRSGLSRVFYGSVAAGVLHRIERPLLLVRADEGGSKR